MGGQFAGHKAADLAIADYFEVEKRRACRMFCFEHAKFEAFDAKDGGRRFAFRPYNW